MEAGERLAHAVLLFYRDGMWDETKKLAWGLLTDDRPATTRTLGDMAREVLGLEHTDDQSK